MYHNTVACNWFPLHGACTQNPALPSTARDSLVAATWHFNKALPDQPHGAQQRPC